MTGESSVGFARAAFARSLPDFVARYPHVSAERLLNHAAITPEVLADPNGRLDFKRWVELFEIAAVLTGDPTFGVTFANQVPWRDVGTLAYVIFNSPTLGAALGNACRYLGILQTPARARLHVGNIEARLIIECGHPAIQHHTQHSEAMLALFARICREGLRCSTWTPREVQHMHRGPASLDDHLQQFRCPVSFEQPSDALVLSVRDLREPMYGADPGLLKILLEHANACLANTALEDDFTTKVTRVVISSLSSGEVNVDQIARRLGTGARTLQRRLRDNGLSFKQVIDGARFAAAKRYLGDPSLTLTEAALMVGYSDLSSFSRAFRRWSGRSAIDFRREQLRSA